MGSNYIKGGTPVGSEPLCRTCSHAQIMIGYRESERLTICDWVNPNIVVPFVIYECSSYYDKNRPSWTDMKKFALDINLGNPKPAGFKFAPRFGAAAGGKLVPAAEADDDEPEDD